MSLIGALNIGRTALASQQAALQVTGNNIANAGNPNYTRQVAKIVPAADQRIGNGLSIGTGISVESITRQIDEALQGRLRSSVSDDTGASTTKQWLDRVESVFNELGDQDLSTQLSTFFNSWSKLAAQPNDAAQRTVVVQNGVTLAGQIQDVRSSLSDIQTDLGTSIKSMIGNADALASQVAQLNKSIAQAEGGGGGMANSLRDQRDGVLGQLSQLINITTADGNNGMVNVFIGSEPLVMNDQSRGLTTQNQVVNDQTITGLAFKANGATADVTGGQLGAMVSLQSGQLKDSIDQLDQLAGSLIFELNKTFSGGQGAEGEALKGYTSVVSTNAVADANAALNTAGAGLKFAPTNGSFTLSVYDTATKQSVSHLVSVDLDGIGGNDTTLNSLAADINGIAGVSATVTNGRLTIKATAPGTEILFGGGDPKVVGETTGTLAALGINTFFTGTSAQDIGVNAAVKADHGLLAATGNSQPAGNAVADAIFKLQNKALNSLGGMSLVSGYDQMINQAAVAASTADSNASAAATVRQTLEAQRESLSGVSMDEEAVNLMQQQRAFQGAARLVSAIDEMMQTILNMVG